MTSDNSKKYVIFDTDMGCDDAWALQMILKAEKIHQNVELLAITTVVGNTSIDNVIKNTYRILDGLDRTDIPIYKGASEPLIPGELKDGDFHGANGFGDVDFWHPDVYPSDIKTLIHQKNAVEIIRDLAMEHPNRISLVCVGPLTNIALAIKTYPEIKENIKDVCIMGGNYKGVGNQTNCAEFNFYYDPESAYIVFDSLNCPMTILPWECCLPGSIDISMDWRLNVLGLPDCRNVQLLNEIEKICYKNFSTFMPCDAFLTAVFLFPDRSIRTKGEYYVTVELQGYHTRGQMILNHKHKKQHNATLIKSLNEEEIKDILQWTASS